MPAEGSCVPKDVGPLPREQHIKRHKELMRALDELVVDFVQCTRPLTNGTTVVDLLDWAHKQTHNPDEIKGHYH